MRRLAAALVPLIWLSTARALDEPKDKAEPPPKSETPAEKLKDLQKEVQKAQGEIIAKFRKAEKDEEKEELLRQYRGVGRQFAEKFLDLAKSEPKDPAAVQALLFVLSEAASTPEAMSAADRIVKNHLGDPRVLAQIPELGRSPSPAGEKVLRAVMTQARDSQAKATFALAQSLKEQTALARELKDATPDQIKEATDQVGEAGVKRLRDADPDKLENEAADLYERVGKQFGDVRVGRTTLAAQAKGELYELRHLSVGKTAPEIEAEDTDGTKFKLSDYRGKVVMLDFWGNW